MKALTAAVNATWLLASGAYGTTCSCESGATSGPETIIETETANGGRLLARFEADPVTRAVRTASVCTEIEARVTEAKLWMPDMDHGSSPTRLTAATSTCTTVERINFLMRGAWDIQVTLDSGDTGTLSLEVQP